MPVQKLEKSVQVNLEPDEKCLSQTEVSSVPSQKLEEYIQANLKPDEESLKQIDQAVDAISDLLCNDVMINVLKVAKVRLRVGAQDSGFQESLLSPPVVVLSNVPHQAPWIALQRLSSEDTQCRSPGYCQLFLHLAA